MTSSQLKTKDFSKGLNYEYDKIYFERDQPLRIINIIINNEFHEELTYKRERDITRALV